MPYVDSKTAKISGATNTRRDDNRPGGTPGNNIQPVSTLNQAGNNEEFARDDHIHEGVHTIMNMTGSINIIPGYNMEILNGIPVPGTDGNIRISHIEPDFGLLFYDGGSCEEEAPILFPGVGPCTQGEVIIKGLSVGNSNGIILDALNGTMTAARKGIYLVKFDLYADFKTPSAWIATVYNGANRTYCSARATCVDDQKWRLSAHGLIQLNVGNTISLHLTHMPPNSAAVFVYQLQFSAELIDPN